MIGKVGVVTWEDYKFQQTTVKVHGLILTGLSPRVNFFGRAFTQAYFLKFLLV